MLQDDRRRSRQQRTSDPEEGVRGFLRCVARLVPKP